jgi:hypothetical protein
MGRWREQSNQKLYRVTVLMVCLNDRLMKDKIESACCTHGDMIKSKGKFGPVHFMNAYRENRRTAPLILNLGVKLR